MVFGVFPGHRLLGVLTLGRRLRLRLSTHQPPLLFGKPVELKNQLVNLLVYPVYFTKQVIPLAGRGVAQGRQEGLEVKHLLHFGDNSVAHLPVSWVGRVYLPDGERFKELAHGPGLPVGAGRRHHVGEAQGAGAWA